MHVFDTGVGVLSFNISNYNYPDKEDILIINDYGRRIYPQYLSNEGSKKNQGVKGSFLADKIYGHLGDFSFEDNFEQYEDPIENNACFLPPQHIRNIFGYSINEKIGDYGKDFVFRDEEERKKAIRIRQITDDRMFSMLHNNSNIVNSLAKKQRRSIRICYDFELDPLVLICTW